MISKILKKNKGFMMIEVTIVIAIITIVVLSMLGTADKSLFVSKKMITITQATFLLEEGVEITKILRDNNWTNISNLTPGMNYYPVFSGGSWSLSSTPSSVGIFNRTVTIQNVNRDTVTQDISLSGVNDPRTKLVTVTVSWVLGGQTISRTLSFYIFDLFS